MLDGSHSSMHSSRALLNDFVILLLFRRFADPPRLEMTRSGRRRRIRRTSRSLMSGRAGDGLLVSACRIRLEFVIVMLHVHVGGIFNECLKQSMMNVVLT